MPFIKKDIQDQGDPGYLFKNRLYDLVLQAMHGGRNMTATTDEIMRGKGADVHNGRRAEKSAEFNGITNTLTMQT